MHDHPNKEELISFNELCNNTETSSPPICQCMIVTRLPLHLTESLHEKSMLIVSVMSQCLIIRLFSHCKMFVIFFCFILIILNWLIILSHVTVKTCVEV